MDNKGPVSSSYVCQDKKQLRQRLMVKSDLACRRLTPHLEEKWDVLHRHSPAVCVCAGARVDLMITCAVVFEYVCVTQERKHCTSSDDRVCVIN